MSDAFDRAGPALQEVDRLLTDFYQAELPDPWPRLNLPYPLPARPVARPARRPLFRFALAASVAVALLGYWAVAGLFPDTGRGPALHGPEIGQRLRIQPPAKQEAETPKEKLPLPLVGPSDSKGIR